MVKNLSEVKADAGVAVTFYDAAKENLGTRFVVLRDIEPGTVRMYGFRFRPQPGDTVSSCGVVVGEVVGQDVA